VTISRKYLIIQVLLIAAVAAAIAVVYPHMPAQIAVHWNHQQQADHFVSKQKFLWKRNLGLWLMGVVMLLTYLRPWLSPRQFDMESFRSTYLRTMTMSLVFGAYLSLMALWTAFGHRVNVGRAIFGGAFLIAILNGNLLGKVRRNFYLGIKTPWTLTSERVWNATHRFAAKTTVLSGLVGLTIILIGPHRWNAYAISVFIAAALIPRVYSLVLYKQLERRGEL
jgi:uncharacterized membrane protein